MVSKSLTHIIARFVLLGAMIIGITVPTIPVQAARDSAASGISSGSQLVSIAENDVRPELSRTLDPLPQMRIFAVQPVAQRLAAISQAAAVSRHDLAFEEQTSLVTCPTTSIMPLGDSITVGKSSGVDDPTLQISYRKDLWDLLVANDYKIDFVGSQTNGQAYPSFDPNHEGYGGWTDSQIAANIYNWLTINPADVILLHIGTNALDTDPSDVENILKNIANYETNFKTHVTVVLARIINRIPYSTTSTQFNDNVEAMALNRIAAGDDIVIVDMEDGAGIIYDYYDANPPGDMYDYLHPYATGYTKMAAVWYAALTGILSPCSNQPPVIDPIENQTNAEGDSVSLAVVASDPNIGDVLTYSASGLPANLSIDSSSGLIQGLIDYQAAAGSPYSVTVTVTDDGNPPLSSHVQFSWTVDNTNRPPEVIDPGDQSSAEGETISLPIQASDPDGDGLSFSATGLPVGLDIDSLSGIISGTLSYTASISSPHAITITVSDDYSPSASSGISFTWSITDTNRPPIVTNLADQENVEAELVNLQIQADDPDGDTLSYTASGLPDGLAIDPDTGLIHGRLSSQSAGYHSVQVVISDGDVSQDVMIEFTWVVFDRYFIPFLSY
jgi:hypothetical protein